MSRIHYEDQLIAEVEKHPCLYNKEDANYKSKKVKHETWTLVASVTGTRAGQCATRWRSLRDRFVRELYPKKCKPGSALNKSAWPYFQRLTFLEPHVTPKKVKSKRVCTLGEQSNLLDVSSDEFKDETISAPTSVKEDSTFPSTSVLLSDYNADEYITKEEENTMSLAKSVQNKFLLQSTRIRNCDYDEQEFLSNNEKRQRIETSSNNDEPTEQRFDVLCNLTSKLIEKQVAKSKETLIDGPNHFFYKVLEQYMQKHSEATQDRLKIQILNMVFSESIESG